MRLLIVATHAVQYFAPLYRELARRPGLDLTVAFESDYGMTPSLDRQFGVQFQYDVPLTEGYRYLVLPEQAGTGRLHGRLSRRSWSVRHHVAQADAVLLASFLSVTELVAAASAWRRSIPVLYRCESTLLTPRPPWRDHLRHLVLPRLLGRVGAGLYIGQANQDYLRAFGVPEERLHFSPYCVDNAAFSARADALRPRRGELRRAFGLEADLPVVLFSGKLIPKKQPLLLLQAFERLQATCPSQLLVVGDGELRGAFEAAVADRRVPRVHLAGFLNQSRMPEAYAVADVLALPSSFEETWGLAVNEAMCFGVAAVVSDRVGCGADLVEDGVTGHRFRFNDAGALAEALRGTVADQVRCRTMGQAARERIGRYTIQAAADGILQGLRAATRGSV